MRMQGSLEKTIKLEKNRNSRKRGKSNEMDSLIKEAISMSLRSWAEL